MRQQNRHQRHGMWSLLAWVGSQHTSVRQHSFDDSTGNLSRASGDNLHSVASCLQRLTTLNLTFWNSHPPSQTSTRSGHSTPAPFTPTHSPHLPTRLLLLCHPYRPRYCQVTRRKVECTKQRGVNNTIESTRGQQPSYHVVCEQRDYLVLCRSSCAWSTANRSRRVDLQPVCILFCAPCFPICCLYCCIPPKIKVKISMQHWNRITSGRFDELKLIWTNIGLLVDNIRCFWFVICC